MNRDLKAASKISFAAASVLLIGIAAAHSDELADLRASQAALIAQQTSLNKQQELLNARIDQLSQATGPAPLVGAGASGTAVPGAPASGGSFARSFLIPGTETSIRIGGFVDETLVYYLQGGPANGVPDVTTAIDGNIETMPLSVGLARVPGYPSAGNLVPTQVGTSRGNSQFFQTPQKTRLNFETRTPTDYGEARTFIEIDFKGTNSFSTRGENGQAAFNNALIPRLRYAFGSLGGFLAGQANSNFRDTEAEPEVFADDGSVGIAGPQRIPQIRYTYEGPWGTSWSVSAEQPETDIVTPAGKIATDSTSQVVAGGALVPANNSTGGLPCVANGSIIVGTTACTLSADPTKSSAPDLTFASYWAQPWGHVDFRGVIRPTLTIDDGKYVNQTFVGYGGGISGDVKPGWGKDDVQWQFTVGNAIGRYLTSATGAALATNYLVTPASPAAAAGVLVKPVMAVGGVVGYQHWWLPNVRSNIAYGYWQENPSSQLIGPVQSTVSNERLQSANVNVIWSPVAFIDTGVEYMWGQRRVVAGITGQEQVFIGEFRVKF